MKRIILSVAGIVVVAAGLLTPAMSAQASSKPFCEKHPGVCPDLRVHRNYEGEYVGHDEPSVVFYSNRAGSGNSNTWKLQLPHEAPVRPTQDGSGGTWNFQQHITFWFGMDLCETQSYPQPGKPCRRDSDSNIKDSANPSSPDWIGNHPGTGFLELQLYPPGWVPFIVGTSCDPTQWCAAMVTFGLSDSLHETNNQACLDTAGEEWANFAFLTKSGVPQAPPDPLGQTANTFIPDPSKVLFMNAGDRLAVSIHDSAAGLVTAINDLTTGQHGSMTASIANGFAHPLFQPDASTCTERPYAFHPMYSTSSEHTRVPWAAHVYNVAFSDEVGHFEYCAQANSQQQCVQQAPTNPNVDRDDTGCFNASASLLVKIGGCIGSDTDFDGTSYRRDWPGTFANVAEDRRLHSQSFLFTSPLSHGRNYPRTAFEADLPGIESTCSVSTGHGCVNPPPGARFYPLYSTTRSGESCGWREGGRFMPRTANAFGGTSTSEYGPLLKSVYPPFPGFPGTVSLFENFRRILSNNPCASTGALPRSSR